MLKILKKIFIAILVLLTALITFIIIAGIYKFNHLAGKEGYSPDGNKIVKPIPQEKLKVSN